MSLNKDNYLTISDFHKICRICTSKIDLKSLYENLNFIDMLQFCTMIEFHVNDNLPKQICKTCISDLNHVYKFTNKCKTVDSALRKCVKDYEKTISNIKIENNTLGIVRNEVNDTTKSIINVKKENETSDQNIECVFIVKNESINLDYEESDIKGQVDSVENENVTSNISEEINKTRSNTCSDPDFIKEDDTSSNTDGENSDSVPKDTTTNKKNSRRFKCTFCPKSFATKSNYNVHIRIHTGIKPYQCEVCNKVFTAPSTLNTHKIIHTGLRPYQCEICHKSFIQLGNLITHKRIHTAEKPYKCQVCNKNFTQLTALKNHCKIHADEKTYKCQVCNKCFRLASALKNHYRVHTSEITHQCDVCNKLFIEIAALKKHEKIHTGEKPFECEICRKSFVQLGNLMRHKRIHTGSGDKS